MSGPAARALAEWQALRLESYAAQLRISGVPLQARVADSDYHWWEASQRRVADALSTLERLFVSTDDDLRKAYDAERDEERRKCMAARPTPTESR